MSTCIMLADGNISYAAEQNKEVQRHELHKLRLRDVGIGLIATGVLMGIILNSPMSCCYPKGGGEEGMFEKSVEHEGLRFQDWYDDRFYCLEVREAFCPEVKVQDRLRVTTITCSGNCDGHGNSLCYYLIWNKAEAEKKGMIVDDHGYVTYPTPKK